MRIINSQQFDEVIANGITLVDFYADWCGPCKMLGPVLEDLQDEYTGKVEFVKVNCDNDADLAGRFGIASIPNLLIFKDGKVVSQSIGYQDESALKSFIDAAL